MGIMNIRQYKFRTVVSEVSFFVGNPVKKKAVLITKQSFSIGPKKLSQFADF